VGRHAKVRPSRPLHVVLDKEDMDKVDAHLWSEFENRVPLGSYQRFFTALIRHYFETEELDLSPYTGAMPGEQIIRAFPSTLETIKRLVP
jgi:hypothetical protein